MIYNFMLLTSSQYCIFLKADMLTYANYAFLNQSINKIENLIDSQTIVTDVMTFRQNVIDLKFCLFVCLFVFAN